MQLKIIYLDKNFRRESHNNIERSKEYNKLVEYKRVYKFQIIQYYRTIKITYGYLKISEWFKFTNNNFPFNDTYVSTIKMVHIFSKFHRKSDFFVWKINTSPYISTIDRGIRDFALNYRIKVACLSTFRMSTFATC